MEFIIFLDIVINQIDMDEWSVVPFSTITVPNFSLKLLLYIN